MRSTSDPNAIQMLFCAILVRRLPIFTCDPARPLAPFIILKGIGVRVVLRLPFWLCCCPISSRILPRPSKGQWLQTSCFAFLFGGRWQWRESSQRKRGPRHCKKVVAGKLNLNSSLTDSVRLELQVQFASSHFQLARWSGASAPLA